MNTFLRFFYEFISVFFDGLFNAFKGFFSGIGDMFNFGEYSKVINSYKDTFNGGETVFVVITIAILAILVLVIVLLVFLFIRKMIRKFGTTLSKDQLLNEIANLNDKVNKYSLGMRQRLGIARALLNKPNILILDEPTNGLDPEGIKDLRVLLKRLASDGMGILISSHNLAELESFCNKVCIIDNGKIIESSEVTTLKNNENIVVFKVSDTTSIDIKDIFDVNKTSFKVSASKEDVAKIIKKLVKDNIDIYEVKNEELTLEEAFLKKTKGGK